MKYCLLLVTLLMSGILSARTFSVSTTEELNKAIQVSTAKDSILIQGKHRYFAYNILINKPLSIIGSNLPVFDAQKKGEIFIIKSNDVSISGCRFENVGETSMIDWAGIKVVEAERVMIQNNQFYNCYFGIYLSSASHCKILNNTIVGQPKNEQTTGNGIHAWKCDSITIEHNSIEGHRDGIYFEFVTNSSINHNFSTKNIRYGLHFMFSHNDAYAFNVFTKNGAGVAVMYTKHVTMRDNIFDNNWGGSAYGFLLKDISDSHIEHNYFFSNTVGAYMEGCSRLTITQNVFEQNGIGIRIQANCDDNVLTNNNFLGNTFDFATNGSVVYNRLENNYWDKYEGYDLNKDGQGDIPYRPVSLFSTIIERVPQIMVLVRSFTATLLDKIEKILPSFTPENLKDDAPMMKPILIKPFDKNTHV